MSVRSPARGHRVTARNNISGDASFPDGCRTPPSPMSEPSTVGPMTDPAPVPADRSAGTSWTPPGPGSRRVGLDRAAVFEVLGGWVATTGRPGGQGRAVGAMSRHHGWHADRSWSTACRSCRRCRRRSAGGARRRSGTEVPVRALARRGADHGGPTRRRCTGWCCPCLRRRATARAGRLAVPVADAPLATVAAASSCATTSTGRTASRCCVGWMVRDGRPVRGAALVRLLDGCGLELTRGARPGSTDPLEPRARSRR